MRCRVTTHVLDLHRGRPGAGIPVSLHSVGGDGERLVAEGTTSADGRIDDWGVPFELRKGSYRLTFAVAPHFASQGIEAFYDEVQIRFVVRNPDEHHHVPLLMSPFGYSTYRGS